MNLFFDTETSGLPYFRKPSDDPSQPHLIQLAAILADDDGNEVESFSTIVRPYEGCVMAPEAFAAHGISIERAMDEGVDGDVAMDAFLDLVSRSGLLVGHNVPFDIRIMRIAHTRSHASKWNNPLLYYCTMRAATPIVNLPPTPKMLKAGFDRPKSANLSECIQHFFGERLEGAHDALVDVRACKRVFEHLQTMKEAA
jgi:DNA polymerase-3 subunit epsilon